MAKAKAKDDGRIDQAKQEREEKARGAKLPELRRQGERSNAGADTPSGPDTNRTTVQAKRHNARLEAEGKSTDGSAGTGKD